MCTVALLVEVQLASRLSELSVRLWQQANGRKGVGV
jgi:hypothetical protein